MRRSGLGSPSAGRRRASRATHRCRSCAGGRTVLGEAKQRKGVGTYSHRHRVPVTALSRVCRGSEQRAAVLLGHKFATVEAAARAASSAVDATRVRHCVVKANLLAALLKENGFAAEAVVGE